MAKQKFAVTGDQYRTIHRKVRDIFRQLDQKSGSPLNPEFVVRALQDIIEGKFDLMRAKGSIMLESCDGTQLITNAKKTFISIDTAFAAFNDWRSLWKQPTTALTEILIYEKSGLLTPWEVFSSFGVDFSRLCLTQHQIIKFCQNHLREAAHGTMFLTKSNNGVYYFVKQDSAMNGSYINLHKLDRDSRIDDVFTYDVAVPALD